MTSTVGLLVNLLIAGLLAVTIGYCVLLNKRLTRLRADEANLRATISELVTATEIAERAIQGLRSVAADTDRTLGQRLRDAERFSHEIERQIADGEQVFDRIAQITQAVRPARTEGAPAAGVAAPVAAGGGAGASPQDLRDRAAAAAERLARLRRAQGGEAA